MNLAEDIIRKVKSLPEDNQLEILDFIGFILKNVNEEEGKQWSEFSLESAMCGLESEESLYTLEDIKEKY